MRHALILRARAATIVGAVLAGRNLHQALTRDRERHGRHGLVEELAIGTVRYAPALTTRVAPFLERPLKRADQDVYALLLAGLYQAEHMGTPAAVAVSEAVGATAALGKPWARGLLNAVLRAALDAPRDDDPARNHPPWLVDRLRAAWPHDWQAVLAANDTRAPFTLRLDTRRVSRPAYLETLRARGLEASAHPHVATAVVLARAPALPELPGFAEGLVSVQDAAAQWAAPLLEAQPGERVLDACAAPGGKTGHLLQASPGIRLIAADSDRERILRLHDTLARLQGSRDVEVRLADLTAPAADAPFARILLDAPCSATGVIRRHPDIKIHRRASDLEPLCAIQARLLECLWQRLIPGGTLLYVTCSLLPEENTDQLARFLAQTQDARVSPLALPVGRAQDIGWQILPGEADMDGFYYARLTKAP